MEKKALFIFVIAIVIGFTLILFSRQNNNDKRNPTIDRENSHNIGDKLSPLINRVDRKNILFGV